MGTRGVKIRDQGRRGDVHVYFVKAFGRQVCVTVTHHPGTVRRWIFRATHYTEFYYLTGRLVVGLGVQWRTDPRRGGREPVATLQLCIGSRCLIFQIIHARGLPRILGRFLANPDVTFVNVNIAFDCRKLWEEYQLRVAMPVDLWNRAQIGRMSMQGMASRFLGWELDEELKPIAVGRSNWEAEELNPSQVKYACMDVFCSFHLELKFREMYDE